jgi:hypothetical protein
MDENKPFDPKLAAIRSVIDSTATENKTASAEKAPSELAEPTPPPPSIFSSSISDRWKFFSLGEILENPPPPEPPWRIRGLVAEGGGTQVSSQPHGMKSFSWLQASIEAALKRPVWGHFEVAGVHSTLFLETEDPMWMLHDRVIAVCNGLGVKVSDAKDANAGCFTIGALGPFDLVQAEREILSVLDRYKPDFCVLSTLQGLLGDRDWTKQADMSDVNALLVRISADYCPLVTITHSPQDKKLRRAAGTITQAANFPTIMHYEKQGTGEQVFSRIRVDSKMGEPEKFKLKMIRHIGEVRFEWSSDLETKDLETYIREHPDESSGSIADQFNRSSSYIRRLRRMGNTPSKMRN